jgi:hypothetical protein
VSDLPKVEQADAKEAKEAAGKKAKDDEKYGEEEEQEEEVKNKGTIIFLQY